MEDPSTQSEDMAESAPPSSPPSQPSIQSLLSDLRSASSSSAWNLSHDADLCTLLALLSSKFQMTASATAQELRDLESVASSLAVDVKCGVEELRMLSDGQFVENRVYDDEEGGGEEEEEEEEEEKVSFEGCDARVTTYPPHKHARLTLSIYLSIYLSAPHPSPS